MTHNKSKSRRERRKADKECSPDLPGNRERLSTSLLIRLAMLVPPAMYACYLIWDLYQP